MDNYWLTLLTYVSRLLSLWQLESCREDAYPEAAARGNTGGEASNPGPDSQEQELVESATGVKEKPGDEVQMNEGSGGVGGIERVDSISRSAFTWLDKLRYSKGITEIEPYSNLEDFITFLSKDGGSSSKGRLEEHEVEESNSSRLKVQQLARYNSALSSELSSKQASGGGPQDGNSLSPALVSCDESSAQVQQHQLRSDASLPTAFRQSFSVADASEPLDLKKKGQFPRFKGFAGNQDRLLTFNCSCASCCCLPYLVL